MNKEFEQKIFESKLLHAVRNFGTAYQTAKDIIELAERYGIFDGVKFGNEQINEKSYAQISSNMDSERR